MLSKTIARQLGHPKGIIGRQLGRMWNRRNAALNLITLQKLDLQPDDRVLEIGFGGGYLLERMMPMVTEGYLAGVDISAEMVTLVGQRFRPAIRDGKLELQCSPVESLPFSGAHFNKICSVNSIFYWQDVPHAFEEIRRVLTEAGQLLLCFTCRESLANKEFTRHGVRTYDIEQVDEMLSDAGFGRFQRTRHHDRHREFWCLIANAE